MQNPKEFLEAAEEGNIEETRQQATGSKISHFSPRVLLSALVLGIAIPVYLFLPEEIGTLVIALTIAIIAGAYIGFGVSDGRPGMLIMELIVAGLFCMMALLGILWSPYWFAFALFAHGLWDLAHHNSSFGAKVPHWYIPFCVVIDWVAAAGLVILL